MKTARVLAYAGQGLHSREVRPESPGFVQGKPVMAGSSLRGKGGMYAKPGLHSRILPEKTAGGILEQDKSPARSHACKKSAGARMQCGRQVDLSLLISGRGRNASRVLQSTDREWATRAQAGARKRRTRRSRTSGAHQATGGQSAEFVKRAVTQEVETRAMQ